MDSPFAAYLVSVPLLALAGVLVLIAVRQVGNVRLQIWQIMTGAALVVLVTGSLSLDVALQSVNLDVLLFLFGTFIIGQGLEESGYLGHVSYKYFKRATSLDQLFLIVMLGAGVASAVLMNDTVAIIGTPVVLLLARRHAISAKPLLLALAFSITIGSVMSPIGNPQNLLIALHGNVPDPFITFLHYLLVPTVLNLFAAFLLLRHYHRSEWHDAELRHSQEPIRDHALALLSKISLQTMILLVIAKTLLSLVGAGEQFRLTHIALASCLPVLVGSSRRWGLLRRIDWHTLIFFAAMFILMEGVWRTGFFQGVLAEWDPDIRSPEIILAWSVIGSQFISNVPLVALSLPLLDTVGAGTGALMALAAGSTVAGNMFILGAASNVIIIQRAEGKAGETLGFWEFARVGVPLTIINGAIYWLFL
jgi:Na+/H+ antiporter NhaD/arsenite permease-like protein